jgi:hypothetical protein
MIICAAVKVEHSSVTGVKQLDLIIGGYRHGNCLEVVKNLDLNIDKVEQGFINHKGEFLDRKEAFKHVIEIGQCTATQRYYWEDHNQTELYSEDLY